MLIECVTEEYPYQAAAQSDQQSTNIDTLNHANTLLAPIIALVKRILKQMVDFLD